MADGSAAVVPVRYLRIDRSYLGHIGLGVLKLITIGGRGIWYIFGPGDDPDRQHA